MPFGRLADRAKCRACQNVFAASWADGLAASLACAIISVPSSRVRPAWIVACSADQVVYLFLE